MKFLKPVAVLAAFFCLLFTFPAFAQTIDAEPAKRTIGLSANIQNSEFGLTVPFFLTQRFVLAPSVGLRYADNLGTDLALAIVPKFYYSTEKFAPYSLLRIGAILNMPSNENLETQTDFLAGIGSGAEYFLVPNFSFGVEGQLNATFSDEFSNRFGNAGGINLNLATVVTANIYFTK
jgi:hypothetical protein